MKRKRGKNKRDTGVDTSIMIDNILKMPLISATSFAQFYLENTDKLIMHFPVSRASSMRSVIKEITEIKDSFRDRIGTSMPGSQVSFDEVIHQLATEYSSALIHSKSRLPQNLRMKDDSIYSALADFEVMMEECKNATRLLHLCYKREYLKDQREKLSAINKLLRIPLPPLISDFLEQEKARLGLNHVRKIKLDDVKKLLLFQVSAARLGTLLRPEKYNPEGWLIHFLVYCAAVYPERVIGRPSQLLYKTLQIVIYTILAHRNKKISKMHKRKMAADIINEFNKGKNLKWLSEKDIENVLHLTT